MPYKFKCRECKEFVYIEVLKESRTVYNCQHCGIDNEMTPKQAEKNFKIQEIAHHEYDLARKTTISNGEFDVNDNDKDIKEYPALKFLSGVANFIAWFGVVTSIIGGLIYLNSDVVKYGPIGFTIVTYVGLTLLVFILFVFWRAISEILILFVDMAQDIRRTRLKN